MTSLNVISHSTSDPRLCIRTCGPQPVSSRNPIEHFSIQYSPKPPCRWSTVPHALLKIAPSCSRRGDFVSKTFAPAGVAAGKHGFDNNNTPTVQRYAFVRGHWDRVSCPMAPRICVNYSVQRHSKNVERLTLGVIREQTSWY